ncbi:RING-H2 finger protein ATL39-like [Ananas comosus]|uniref:RING-type E3 ubiquitin transferase n=1 Tax=Ananas comosus TaxID=4615 RepID=A0A6P5EIU4_ANACO|nr:RING-H2 finger protein ATL39-like [Ananas comosus]
MSANGDNTGCCGASSTLEIVGISFASFFALFMLTCSVRCFRQREARRQGRPKPPCEGLDPAEIAALPTFPYKRITRADDGAEEKGAGAMECSICLSVVEEGEVVKMLPRCTHSFHGECIELWLRDHATCPVCRTEILGAGDGEEEGGWVVVGAASAAEVGQEEGASRDLERQ